MTHALLPGSLAIGAGSNALAVDASGSPLINDQRGEDRVESGTVDIGAVEGAFLLGDTSLSGIVNFLDIPPFISLLSSSTFLNEADINRDGKVDFLDITPFVALLSSGSSASSKQSVGQSGELAFVSGSALTAEVVVEPLVVSVVSKQESVISVASTDEVPITTDASLGSKADFFIGPAAISQDVNVATPLSKPSRALVSESLASMVDQTSLQPAVDITAIGETPFDSHVGPGAFASGSDRFLEHRHAYLRGSENYESFVERRSLAVSVSSVDSSWDTRDSASKSIGRSFSTAAELFDAHPESLDEVFDFELEETLTGLI